MGLEREGLFGHLRKLNLVTKVSHAKLYKGFCPPAQGAVKIPRTGGAGGSDKNAGGLVGGKKCVGFERVIRGGRLIYK